mmetsp:Transcript_18050/g.13087  ORF Transcript_18050/g.13087 Transcript_18050/m.13087 type:complete len:139 (-) Transcript_18050:2889-3305(-)
MTCVPIEKECPLRYFYNARKVLCEQCDENCLECTGPRACTKCERHSKTVEKNGKIICRRKCFEDGEVWDDQNSKCIKDGCPDGQYLNDSMQCSNCSYGCKKCSENNTCDTCNSDFVKTAYGQCVKDCPDYNFWNRTSH